MPVIITLKDIEETIDNLNYRSQTTLKSKLVLAIRDFYPDENAIETLDNIDTEQLVKIVWETGEDSALIKTKRKNFSSLKSSVNSDLKKLYQEGRNPRGIIISHNNIFDISEEAKNKTLANIADIFREQGIDSQSRIKEILHNLQDISATAISAATAAEAHAEIDRLKNLIATLSGKFGLPEVEPDKEATAGEKGIAEEIQSNVLADIADILKDKGSDYPDKITKIMETVRETLSTAITWAGPELNTQEAEQIKSIFGDLSVSLQTLLAQTTGTGQDENLAGIADHLQEQSTETRNMVSTIVSAVNEMLTNTIATAAAGLNSNEMERIKNLFGTLADKIKSALSAGGGLDDIEVESREQNKDDGGTESLLAETAAEIAEPGFEEIIEVIEESDASLTGGESVAATEEAAISGETELAPDAELEDILFDQDTVIQNVEEELPATEAIEIIEEIIEDAFTEPSLAEQIPPEEILAEAAPDDSIITSEELIGPDLAEFEQDDSTITDYEEIVEIDDSITGSPEALEEEILAGEPLLEEIIAEDSIIAPDDTLSAENALDQTAFEEDLAELEEVEIVEEADDEIIEEQFIEEAAGEAVDIELQDKAAVLAQLAEAAKALEKIGPDLSSSIFSEEEIKEKAEFLSEEFERYLSVREKFYNQHILIKGGNYRVGAVNSGKQELPEQIVTLREFYIGKFPVTNALFEIFVEKTGYITTAERYGFGMVYVPRMQKIKNALTGTESFIWNSQLQHNKIPGACWYRPNGPTSTLYVKRNHPVVQVSLEDACAFAAWTGKRIPSEKEWEAAARTSRGYLYPWGNTWRDDACNLEKSLRGDTSPVDTYVKFANEYEVADTLGNVLEWTLDTWQTTEQGEENEDTYVVKGASWISDYPVSLPDRQPLYKAESSNILGFRCIAI